MGNPATKLTPAISERDILREFNFLMENYPGEMALFQAYVSDMVSVYPDRRKHDEIVEIDTTRQVILMRITRNNPEYSNIYAIHMLRNLTKKIADDIRESISV